MSRGREPFVEELADTVRNLFAEGKRDPSAKEIAAAHFPDRALSPGIVEEIRSRLLRVRDVLAEDELYYVHLTGKEYYDVVRKKGLPQTEAEARRYLPMGHGNRAEGIRQAEHDDLIWTTALRQNFVSGAAKVGHTGHRIEKANAGGMLSDVSLRSLVTSAGAAMGRMFTASEPLPREDVQHAVLGVDHGEEGHGARLTT